MSFLPAFRTTGEETPWGIRPIRDLGCGTQHFVDASGNGSQALSSKGAEEERSPPLPKRRSEEGVCGPCCAGGTPSDGTRGRERGYEEKYGEPDSRRFPR